MNFESHITFDPIEELEETVFDNVCSYYGFKRAQLYKMNGVKSQKDTFATARSNDLNDLNRKMMDCVHDLCRLEFVIRRAKIEAILIDIRY